MIAVWVIYDHPSDYPHNYVARLWIDGSPTGSIMVAPDIEIIRAFLRHQGCVRLERAESDDPVVVEAWIV